MPTQNLRLRAPIRKGVGAIATIFGWPFFATPARNPLLADPGYAALAQEEAERRKRHLAVRDLQLAKTRMIHAALKRATA